MRISDWSSDVCSSDLELRLSRCIVGRQEHRCLDCRTPGYCATECSFRPKLERRITRADAKNIDLIRRKVVGDQDVHERTHYWEIGRASCRESVVPYVEISVVVVSLKTKNIYSNVTKLYHKNSI